MSTSLEKNFKTPCVLVMEHNPTVRAMLQNMLELLGVFCHAVEEPNQAFEKYEEGVDLVLMDLRLYFCNGLELTECLRMYDEKLGRRTPIIGNISSVEPESTRELCLQAGMDAVYPKLTSLQNLYEVLTQWIDYPLVMPVHMWDVHVKQDIHINQ